MKHSFFSKLTGILVSIPMALSFMASVPFSTSAYQIQEQQLTGEINSNIEVQRSTNFVITGTAHITGNILLDNSATETDNITFSGGGTLIVDGGYLLNGYKSTTTIEAGTAVKIGNGMSVGASGSQDGKVIVNGDLYVTSNTSAIVAETIKIGSTGKLEVSCEQGVKLNASTTTYKNAFTIQKGGQFIGNATECNVSVYVGYAGSDYQDLQHTMQAINIPSNYLPSNYEYAYVTENDNVAYILKATSKTSPVLASEEVTGASDGVLRLMSQVSTPTPTYNPLIPFFIGVIDDEDIAAGAGSVSECEIIE